MTSMAAEIKVSLDSTDLFIFSGAAGDGIIAEHQAGWPGLHNS
jgi:hypothetical protein